MACVVIHVRYRVSYFPPKNMFELPTTTAPTILANISATLGDSGMLALLAIIMGVPLAFWVVHAIAGLAKVNDDIKRADRAMDTYKTVSKRMGNKEHFYLP